jgi:hypothetical protein
MVFLFILKLAFFTLMSKLFDNYLVYMRGILKNVPPINISLAGNRGKGFPVVSSCQELEQVLIQLEDIECWLVKEEDGYTNIFTDRNNLIGVDCTEPIEAPCFIICQELHNKREEIEILLEQTDIDPETGAIIEYTLFCDGLPEPEIAFISLQEDITVPILFDPYETIFKAS